MLQQIVAAYIDDDRQARAYARNVSKILIRPNAEINAARDAKLAHLDQHMLIRGFVRDQVIRIEVAAGLRQSRRQRDKRLVVFGVDAGCAADEQGAQNKSETDAKQK